MQCSPKQDDRLQVKVFKGSFERSLKGVMFLKWKLVNQNNILIYHKTYVILGGGGGQVNNLHFQNQPQDYDYGKSMASFCDR